MKTGRMAPVKGQLTGGALTPSNGVCVHTNMCTHLPPVLKNTATDRVMGYKKIK